MDTFAKRLTWARSEKSMSQESLAKAAEVSQSTIGNLEAGIRNSARRIAAIAAVLDVNPLWLSDGVGPIKSADTGGAVARPTNAIDVNHSRFRQVPVVGRAMGGLPDRSWGDGDYPAGDSDCYAEIASQDPNAFIVPIEGESMSPRFNPGEFALVEPNTAPELEDDVLVKLGDGKIMIKRLLSQRGVIRLGSYNSNEIISAPPETLVWMYYVAHPVPARKIKQRT
tara:strand:- start:432759 stop:433433 length:675 start_codon:yes stop_codon:yes gene_type:complete